MRYFLLSEDKNYTHAPQITNWFNLIDVRDIQMGKYSKIPKRMLLPIEENEKTIFTDVIFFPFFLVSKSLKDCLMLYEPNLQFKEFILLDKKYRKMQEYFLPALTDIDCLTKNCKFNLDRSRLFHIEIDLDRVKDKSIFTLAGVRKRYIIARLDVVESFLRREAKGLLLQEVDCTKGGKLCQRTVQKVNI